MVERVVAGACVLGMIYGGVQLRRTQHAALSGDVEAKHHRRNMAVLLVGSLLALVVYDSLH
jgi:hypothetical protein